MHNAESGITNIFNNVLSQQKDKSENLVACKFIINCPYYSPNTSKCENPRDDEDCLVSQSFVAGFV